MARKTDQHGTAPYEFHGVDFQRATAREQRGECPFCYDSQETPALTFYVNKTSGQFSCKSCGKEGNAYAFLEEYYQLCKSETTKEYYAELADLLGLPPEAPAWGGWAFDLQNNRWLIPVRNEKGTMLDLRVCWEQDGKLSAVRSTAGMSVGMYLLDQLRRQGTVYLCEGEKDAIALLWLLCKSNKHKQASVLGIPGEKTFKDAWADHFKNRDVAILYDQGATGHHTHVIPKLAGASTIKSISWPGNLDRGYDVRDFVKENLRGFRKALSDLLGMLEEVRTETRQQTANLKPITFQTLLRRFQAEGFRLTANKREVMAVACAVIFSTQLPGDPLWMFLVGASGSGKNILSALQACACCEFRNCVSPRELVSGYVRHSTEEDYSLLPKLHGKTLVTEDFTEVLQMPKQDQAEVFKTLRGVYKGDLTRSYGHGVLREYQGIRFSIVAGVTHAIHAFNQTDIGERFLKVEWDKDRSESDHEQQVRAALRSASNSADVERRLREPMQRFLDRPIKLKEFPKLARKWEDRLVALSQLVAKLRFEAPRDRGGQLLYRPVGEVGTRLVKQFTKLARSLCVVYGLRAVNDDVYKTVTRVALDTAMGWNLDCVSSLQRLRSKLERKKGADPYDPHNWPKTDDVADIGRMSMTTVHRKLENLLEVGAVIREPIHNGKPGRPDYGYTLTPWMIELWKKAGLS